MEDFFEQQRYYIGHAFTQLYNTLSSVLSSALKLLII